MKNTSMESQEFIDFFTYLYLLMQTWQFIYIFVIQKFVMYGTLKNIEERRHRCCRGFLLMTTFIC